MTRRPKSSWYEIEKFTMEVLMGKSSINFAAGLWKSGNRLKILLSASWFWWILQHPGCLIEFIGNAALTCGTEDLTKFIKRKFRSLYFRIGEFSKHWHQQSLQRTVTAKKTWCKEDLMKRTVSAKKRHCKERTGTAKNNHYNCRVIIVNIMLLIASIWWSIHYQ